MHRVYTHYIADICQAAGCQARPCHGRQTNVNMTLRSATALLQHGTPFLSPLKTSSLISDIAIFMLKRDVKLQLTNSIKNCSSLYSFKRHLKSHFIAQLINN